MRCLKAEINYHSKILTNKTQQSIFYYFESIFENIVDFF